MPLVHQIVIVCCLGWCLAFWLTKGYSCAAAHSSSNNNVSCTPFDSGSINSMRFDSLHQPELMAPVMQLRETEVSSTSSDNGADTHTPSSSPPPSHSHLEIITPIKSDSDKREYRVITLSNQLQAVLIHDDEADKASCAMDVKVGSFSDPDDVPGLAHFLEHMLFLGTEAFPSESEYNSYLNAHGGDSNAFTSSEDTNYYFSVRHEYLAPMLERFAAFFISPLFTPSATDREIQAVNNEHAKNLLSDMWRTSQLLKHMALPEHVYSKFGTGDVTTLKEKPKAAGIDVRARLLEFHDRYYSANVMKLAVSGRESLDELQALVETHFLPIKNKQLKAPSFEGRVFDLSSSSPLYHSKLCVVPVKDQRTLAILFPLPETLTLSTTKPLDLISHLVGHEGPGSVLSYLKLKTWANSLSSGLFEDASSFSLMSITLELTEEGLHHIVEITAILFSYLKMLGEATSEEWHRIFEEERAIHHINFKFKSKESPASYASHLAAEMHLHPNEKLLAADYLYEEFNEELIRSFLARMNVNNMLLKITSKTFAREASLLQKEPVYQSQFFIEKLTDVEWHTISEPPKIEALHLPTPNQFIATDFSLREPPADSLASASSPNTLSTAPILIAASSDFGVETWHKLDTVFRLPKANVVIKLVSPIAFVSPRCSVLTSLYLRLLEDALAEFTYSAELAGLTYSLTPSATGLQLVIKGFSHKLSVLVEEVLKQVKHLEVKEERFLVVKEQLKRSLKNFDMQQVYEHAIYYSSQIMETNTILNDEKIMALEPVTSADVKQHLSELWRQADLVAFCHGNLDVEQSLSIAKIVARQLNTQPLFQSQRDALRVVRLEEGHAYRHALPVLNSNEKNSAIYSCYQIGEDTVQAAAMLDMFAQMIRDSCFHELRTVQQLGYLVFSSAATHRGVLSFRIILQSSDYHPLLLESRAEAFLANFRAQITDSSAESFEQHRAAVVASKREKDKNLSQETSRLWGEIAIHRYCFERQEQEAKAVEQLTRQSLVAFFDRYLNVRQNTRAKLIVSIFGSQHNFDGTTKQVAISGQSAAEDAVRAASADKSVEDEIGGVTDELASEDPVNPAQKEDELATEPLDEAKVIVVQSIADFKRSMPLYPCFV